MLTASEALKLSEKNRKSIEETLQKAIEKFDQTASIEIQDATKKGRTECTLVINLGFTRYFTDFAFSAHGELLVDLFEQHFQDLGYTTRIAWNSLFSTIYITLDWSEFQ